MHYVRWQRHGDPTITKTPNRLDHAARFMAKVAKQPDGCWYWVAYVAPNGYGKFGVGREKVWVAHVWAYQHWVGPIPEGWDVDHLCHNRDLSCRGGPGCLHRRCVNPAHLEAKPRWKNNEDSNRYLRPAGICINGHPYSPETLFHYVDGSLGCARCVPDLPSGAKWAEWKQEPFSPDPIPYRAGSATPTRIQRPRS